jgi:hypothetical protein
VSIAALVCACGGGGGSGSGGGGGNGGGGGGGGGSSAAGPLVVSSRNPRYFERPDGRMIAIGGSHTWENLIDQGPLAEGDPPVPFDFEDYIDYLESYGHNFTRMWVWENARFNPNTPDSANLIFGPHLPYARTGPGAAQDGKPKFDLNRFDPEYFDRLRRRVERLNERGIYAEIMLFQGWSMGPYGNPPFGNPWPAAIWNGANNVQGLHGDPNGDNDGREVFTMTSAGDIPEIRAHQEAYVRHVIDLLNDLPNVLYEIGNEPQPESVTWQQHMVNVVNAYQATKPKRHPVGMTGCVGGCDTSPNGGVLGTTGVQFVSFVSNLAPSNPFTWDSLGNRVSISDSDHYWDVLASQPLVWQQFLRGHNPVHMDIFDCTPFAHSSTFRDCNLPNYDPAQEEGAMVAIGHVAKLAPHLDLAHMVPNNGISSDGYALADTLQAQKDVLAWTEDGMLSLDLSSGAGESWSVYWLDADDGSMDLANPSVAGASNVNLTSPFGSRSVVLVTQGSSEMSFAPID